MPDSVLWRKKEAFSDGVSTLEDSWYSILTRYIDTKITDDELQTSGGIYTKEQLYYRKIYIQTYGEEALTATPYYWMPRRV